MKKDAKKVQIFVLFALLFLLISGQAVATKVITLATAEQEPYIGESLPNKGYVYELVTEVFNRAGYKVNIVFYPLARAKSMAELGEVDGVLPVYYDEDEGNKLAFSDPFKGTTISILKKKSLKIAMTEDMEKNPEKALQKLKKYKFGVRNGAVVTPAFDNAKYLKKEIVTNDIQNIIKLQYNRIDLVIIDKFTASDLLVKEAPHLIGQLELMEQPLAINDFHVAFSKKSENYQQILKDFNGSLKSVIQDGTYEKILAKHGLYIAKKKKNGKIKLTIGTVDNGDMLIMQRISKEYEKLHPNIILEWKVLDEETLRKRLLADMAISDGQFDIMTIGAYETPIWAERNWLIPLTNIPNSYDIKDVLKPIKDALTYKNKLYALPFYAESSMLFYRRDLFDKAGIRMPENPTYEEIMKFAEKIHDPKNKIYGIGLRGKAGWGSNMSIVDTMINTFGGQWFDMNWKTMINTPEWYRALTVYKTLLTKYGPPNPTENNFNELKQLFSDGKLGMWVDATVAAGMLYDSKKSKVYNKLGFASAPIGITKKGSNWLWVWSLAIPSSSKVSKEAENFILWATSKEYVNLVAKSDGWLAVPSGTRMSTYKNKNYQAVAPFADFVLKTIQSANPVDKTLKPAPYKGIQFVGIPEFPSLGEKVGVNIAEMIDGKMTITEVLKKSQDLVSEQMKKSGYLK